MHQCVRSIAVLELVEVEPLSTALHTAVTYYSFNAHFHNVILYI